MAKTEKGHGNAVIVTS